MEILDLDSLINLLDKFSAELNLNRKAYSKELSDILNDGWEKWSFFK